MKILLITNIPNPYRIPLFNTLFRELSREGNEFQVLFAVKGYSRRKFKDELNQCIFPYSFLGSGGIRIGKSEGLLFTYPGVIRSIRKSRPDRIIVSGFSLATVKLWLMSILHPLSYIIWSGSVSRKGRFDSLIRRQVRKRLVSRAHAFVAYGTLAKAYLAGLGAAPSRIHIGINTVDTAYFRTQTFKLRTKNSLNEKPVLTYVGYLTERKNVGRLIDLAIELQTKISFEMQIIGDGDQRESLIRRTQEAGIDSSVVFTGFKQKTELPFYLAKSDLFLFQTDFDIWGLVLNEAMSAGCCCLASAKAGSAHDLIDEGKTGFIVNFQQVQSVARLIVQLLENRKHIQDIGLRASEHIQKNASLDVSAQGFLKAINS